MLNQSDKVMSNGYLVIIHKIYQIMYFPKRVMSEPLWIVSLKVTFMYNVVILPYINRCWRLRGPCAKGQGWENLPKLPQHHR